MSTDESTSAAPVALARRGPPLRQQLADGLRDAIRDGRLAAGARLPATRGLADDLGVSRGVVTDAYAQLAAEGWLDVHHARRPVVRALSHPPVAEPQAAAPGWRYDLTPNAPDLAAFPRTAWAAAVRRVLATVPDADLDYPDARGPERARGVLAGYLARTRGAIVDPERLLVVSGFTQALAIVCRALATAGARRLAIEDPSLDDAWGTVRAGGLEPVGIPVDRDGIVVDALEAANADGVLVTPAHQFPTGARLAPGRRRALIAWAERGGVVIEDDYDGEHGDPRAPAGVLQALAPERVVLIGSVSKTLAPALRLGWLHVPASLADAVVAERWYLDSGGPAVDALALADLVERGELERHLRRTRAAYRTRRRGLVEALAAIGLHPLAPGVRAGMHLCVELPAGVDETAVATTLQAQRINVRALGAYRLAHPGPPGLVIGYGRLAEGSVPAIVDALVRAGAASPARDRPS
jgi:GntR family transcriptional regulator/MocR family aminotransferase